MVATRSRAGGVASQLTHRKSKELCSSCATDTKDPWKERRPKSEENRQTMLRNMLDGDAKTSTIQAVGASPSPFRPCNEAASGS